MTDTSGSNQPIDPTAAPADGTAPITAAPVTGAPATGAPVYPPPPTPKKVSTAIKVLSAVLAVVVAGGAYFGVRALLDALGGPSKQQVIEKGVEEALKMYSPPQQVDEVTLLTDITAEPDAIHYHYTLVDIDPSVVTADALSEIILPGLCSTRETRSLLDKDIAMKYSYLVESSGDVYDLEFVKGDC